MAGFSFLSKYFDVKNAFYCVQWPLLSAWTQDSRRELVNEVFGQFVENQFALKECIDEAVYLHPQSGCLLYTSPSPRDTERS
eukprot:11860015-Karenia_brevis.AAC.1